MKNIIFIFALFILLSCNSESTKPEISTGEVIGKIRDYDTNQLVSSANVYTIPATTESTTGPGGVYQLTIEEEGAYQIIAEKNGYFISKKDITVGKSREDTDIDLISEQNWTLNPGGINGAKVVYENDRIVVSANNWVNDAIYASKTIPCKNQQTYEISCKLLKDIATSRVGLFALYGTNHDEQTGVYKTLDEEQIASFNFDVFDKTIDHINEIVVDTTYIEENGEIIDSVLVTIPQDTVYVDSTSFSVQLRVEGGSLQGYFSELLVDSLNVEDEKTK